MFSSNSADTIYGQEENFDTLVTNGIFTTQTQLTKYTPKRLKASTGEWMQCLGRNNLGPLNVLINPFIGPVAEMNDVDTESFQDMYSYLHPVKLFTNTMFRLTNFHYGVKIEKAESEPKKSINNFSLKISEMSIAQETDLESHQKKYQCWKEARPNKRLMLYGISRGAATVFISASKCPEVEIVILEGCFYSVTDLIERSPYPLSAAQTFVQSGLSFFTKYKAEGPSPHHYIKDFPPNIPVVFITSENDIVVPSTSTKKLAEELNERGKNPVYLITLKRSSHPNYMFDDIDDHNTYERVVNAVYKKHGFPHDPNLAALGEPLLESCLLKQPSERYQALN